MGKVIYSLFIIAVICFFIFINNCNFYKNSHLGELIDYYTVLCCERESIIKYIITLSDTKKMKFQKLRRLNHKLSTDQKGYVFWATSKNLCYCPALKYL